MSDLSRLFAPERIAVVGATDREGSVGRAVMTNLLSEFDGEVVPVNPTYETLFDVPCLDAVADADADLVVVVVPPKLAVEVVREAGESGVRAVVVITAGFGEAGGEGVARERELAAVADEYDIDLVGPNSLGVLSTRSGLNATFGPRGALPGDVSFMSQSGAFVTAVLDWAAERELGFVDIVSLGNEAVLDESAFVEFWGEDPETDVVLGYLEGIEDGERFVRVAREVTRETPVVLVKSGRTEAGAHAAASHTGSIAGSEAAYEAGLEKAGVLRAESVEELFDYASVLAGQPLPEADGVAVVTNAGGPGVMATDAVGDSGLDLASFSGETMDALRERLPDNANVYNPIDVIGDAPVERFADALDVALADPNVGAAVVMSCPTQTLSFDDLAEAVVDLRAKHGVPVAACLMGGASTETAEQTLAEAGIPSYFDPARAVRALDALRSYREVRDAERAEPERFDVDRERAREVLSRAADRGESRLGVEAMGLLEAYGIPIPEGEVVDSPAAAERRAAELGGDVVMKIVSPDILHKTDIGGVEVGVPLEDVRDTYEDLVSRARRYQPDATLLGVQVQELLDTDAGVETIVGTNRDPQFGPLVLFGLGGVFVEVMEDTTVRLAPVTGAEAREMIDEIRAAPLLRGARGREPVDEASVVDTVQRLSQLVTDFPAILELDVNPLVVTPDGATAVDVRLTIDPDELETADEPAAEPETASDTATHGGER
ncbi:acetate--CoA ligase family protein [Salinirubellus salinus]|uniref:acetate--CoA ligase (ADP-forming) n=1 Tax=Salinirubellus salinus TaxID=1364945 RepID=A0A9E7U995_9EURY|nr:acetate--CoA ligase [Salinirubellus salinus]UWM55711.1 acetate--CoA ligase family protein [Salinirubellus salinus]